MDESCYWSERSIFTLEMFWIRFLLLSSFLEISLFWISDARAERVLLSLLA